MIYSHLTQGARQQASVAMSIDYFLRVKKARIDGLTVAEIHGKITETFPRSEFGEGSDMGVCLIYREGEHIADIWIRDKKEKSLTWGAESKSVVEYIDVCGHSHAIEAADFLSEQFDLKEISDFDVEEIVEPPAIRLQRARGEIIDTKWGTFSLQKEKFRTMWVCPDFASSPGNYAEISLKNTPKENPQDTLKERVEHLSGAFESELKIRSDIAKQAANEMKQMYGEILLGLNLVGIRIESDRPKTYVSYYHLAYASDEGAKFWEAEVDISNHKIEYVGVMIQEPDRS